MTVISVSNLRFAKMILTRFYLDAIYDVLGSRCLDSVIASMYDGRLARYALADKPKIIRLKELHGDRWHEFYERYEEVRGFLSNEFEPQPIRTKNYSPTSDSVADFINDLKNEKLNTK